ncbi:hypothetical protein BJ508DRAFT_314691 [Ascobolus immersus RN42]|uniref:Uncharacterized protein n=1 Tax=Ascobolus immersus RN42 TaxID=1160509 RepID=A0A3N4HK23_ASCIM|nr:hypothetical protein BJ508DRAFT_314691 [Ascobolus immersus RN42]
MASPSEYGRTPQSLKSALQAGAGSTVKEEDNFYISTKFSGLAINRSMTSNAAQLTAMAATSSSFTSINGGTLQHDDSPFGTTAVRHDRRVDKHAELYEQFRERMRTSETVHLCETYHASKIQHYVDNWAKKVKTADRLMPTFNHGGVSVSGSETLASRDHAIDMRLARISREFVPTGEGLYRMMAILSQTYPPFRQYIFDKIPAMIEEDGQLHDEYLAAAEKLDPLDLVKENNDLYADDLDIAGFAEEEGIEDEGETICGRKRFGLEMMMPPRVQDDPREGFEGMAP